ncbi:MAG: cation transporter, partial [Pseudomonadota bacterium]|nr:cation transporter [Pseudomonadota bacterium]
IGLLTGVVVLMYLAMGGSQAMKTALVEDMLSLVPPITFLVAARFSRKPPDEEYLDGRNRAFDVNFLVSAVALTGVGLFLIYDSLSALIGREHPTIGAFEFRGQVIWMGWVMIAALVVSVIPPVVLGRMKHRLASELHLKPLQTDADMNKADWMTGLTGVAGIVGIGFGLWWADAAAALLISASVLKDGLGNLKSAIRDLHDARPETTDRKQGDPLVGRVHTAVSALDWVEDCSVRLHEEGPRLCGLVIVSPRDGRALATRLAEAQRVAREVHWRMDEVVATFAVALDATDDRSRD